MPEPDKYDRAIAYLTEHPERIGAAWHASDRAGWPLFQFVTPTGDSLGYEVCGCLTTIRRDARLKMLVPDEAWTPELTAAIIADNRLPDDPNNITTDHLEVFAEWQRKIDKALNRVPSGDQ